MHATLRIALLLLAAPAALANWPLPPHVTFPCTPPNDPCYQCDDWPKNDAYQVRLAERSPRNTASGPDSAGLCNGFNRWCFVAPQLTNVSHHFVPDIDGNPRVQFTAQYDFPNSYCQFWDVGGSCGWSVWPIPWPDYNLALDLRRNGSSVLSPFSSPPIPAIYESGLWMPTQPVSACNGASSTYTVRAVNKCWGNVDVNVVVANPTAGSAVCSKPDRRTEGCPVSGGPGGPPGIGVGMPVNVGSGNVQATVDLFSVDGAPRSMHFRLDYHSGKPLYPALVSTPLSSGWTHSYNQTLRAIDPFGVLLYHITPEGFESLYELGPDGLWHVSSPAELRSMISKSGTQYLLRDLDGTVTAFDVGSGRWLSTTDRWGNAVTGTYTSGSLTVVTDSMGRAAALGYTSGRLTSIAVGGNTWRFEYGGGNLAKIFDPLHASTTPWRSMTYGQDSSGATRLLTEVRDESGMLLEGHDYDAQDRGRTSVAEGGRDSITIEYDVPAAGQRRVTQELDGATDRVTDYTLTYHAGRYLATQITGTCVTCGSSSDTQSFTYDGSNHVQTHTDGEGHVTSATYNSDGNVISRTEAQGTPEQRTTTYVYGRPTWPNFVTQVTQPSAAKSGASKLTTWSWNASETVLTTTESGWLDAAAAAPTVYTSVTTFDAQHRVLSVDGPRTDKPDIVNNTYYANNDPLVNRRGRLMTTTDPAGLASTFGDYDVFGNTRAMTDPNGVLTEHVMDARGRITHSKVKPVAGDPQEAAEYTTVYTYDGRDRLTDVMLPRGNRLRHVHEDGTNRLTDIIRRDAAGNEYERRHHTLDLAGAVTTEEDQRCDTPASPCTSWTTRRTRTNVYDADHRLFEVQHPVPAGAKIVHTYDEDGNLATVRDENHAAANTIYAYDALHRLKTVTQKQVNLPGPDVVTSYLYDVHDHLTRVTDPNGNQTSYFYDDFGQMRKQVSQVTGTTTYVYDPAGNLTSTTDANGATTDRVYDAAGRITSATSSRSGAATETVTWTYDSTVATNYGKGRLASMSDPSGTTTYTYERRGLLRTQNQTISSMRYTTRFAYDANGNRQQVVYPSGLVVDYTFDHADRPASARSPSATYVGSVQREPFGPWTELRYGNGTIATRAFDPRYRIQTNTLTLGGALTLARYAYTHDAAGNVMEIADALDPSYTRTFTYDDLNRLRTANAPGLWGSGSYTYDSMGNMMTSTFRASTYIHDGTTPKLTSVTENGVSRGVTYDAAGNETAVGAAASTYSARNLLAAADGLTYVYDGRGVRTVAGGTGTQRRYSLYSPELSLLAESSYTSETYRRIEHHYIWFDGVPVAQADAPATLRANVRWTFPDHLGTPILQTTHTGTIWWRAEHEPYGRIHTLRTPTRHQPLRLPGQEAEQLATTSTNGETERSYNVFRWYRAGWGRYTQADPIGYAGGINWYAYADGNPIVNFDPTGLKTLGIGGMVKNASECCVLISANAPGGGQQQKWLAPGESFGFSADADAIYFKDGSALKIPDWSIYIVYDCDALGQVPDGFFSKPLLSYLKPPKYQTKKLPDSKSQQEEFGGPILPPTPTCECK